MANTTENERQYMLQFFSVDDTGESVGDADVKYIKVGSRIEIPNWPIIIQPRGDIIATHPTVRLRMGANIGVICFDNDGNLQSVHLDESGLLFLRRTDMPSMGLNITRIIPRQ